MRTNLIAGGVLFTSHTDSTTDCVEVLLLLRLITRKPKVSLEIPEDPVNSLFPILFLLQTRFVHCRTCLQPI